MGGSDGHGSRHMTIVSDYSPQHDDPIRAASGQVVQVGREDDEYPGWLWCTATDGRSGLGAPRATPHRGCQR
jgi:hypothetical protein